MTPDPYTLTVELPHWTAFALAQLCKRIGFSNLREKAVDDEEAYRMRDAIDAIQKALADAGCDPR